MDFRKFGVEMAHVHLVGELSGASEVPAHSLWRLGSSQALWCKWELMVGDNGRWMKADGARSQTSPNETATVDGDGNPVLSECGQTQVCVCGEDGAAVWSHPIDVHYVTTSLSGWPSLLVEVWAQDSGGRNEIAGYGMAHVPSAPGCYELDIPLWRPLDIRSKDRQARFLASPLRYMSQSISALGRRAHGIFLGVWPRLHNDLNPDSVCEMTNAKKLIYYPRERTADRKQLMTEATGVVKARLSVLTRGFAKLGPGVNQAVELEWLEDERQKAVERENQRLLARS